MTHQIYKIGDRVIYKTNLLNEKFLIVTRITRLHYNCCFKENCDKYYINGYCAHKFLSVNELREIKLNNILNK